jgi:hypothetical protein
LASVVVRSSHLFEAVQTWVALVLVATSGPAMPALSSLPSSGVGIGLAVSTSSMPKSSSTGAPQPTANRSEQAKRFMRAPSASGGPQVSA